MIRRLWLMKSTKILKKTSCPLQVEFICTFSVILLLVLKYNCTYRPHVPNNIRKLIKKEQRMTFLATFILVLGIHHFVWQVQVAQLLSSGCDSRQRSQPCSVWLYKNSNRKNAEIFFEKRNAQLSDISGV